MPVVPLIKIPLNPITVPVLCIVIAPILLLEILVDRKLKSKMPITAVVLAVVDVRFSTMVDEPSKLPIVLPVTLNRPPVAPIDIALNGEEVLTVEARLDVWLMPDMVLF